LFPDLNSTPPDYKSDQKVELEKEAEHIHGIVLSDRTGDMNHEQPNLFNGI